MEPVEIEFVDSSDPAPSPPAGGPPKSRLLWLAVIVVLIGGGIAWSVTRARSGGHNPLAVVVTSSGPSPIMLTVLPSGTEVPALPNVSTSVTCDVAADCTASTSGSNSSVAQAVAQYLPQAELASISTTVGREHGTNPVLTERIIDAHIESVDLLVRVRQYLRPEPDPTTGISPTPPGLGSAFFRVETSSFVVDVQWTGTDATPPPVTALQSLAEDPRLESLG